MSKNLIPEIAKMLGVELGEEFKIIRGNDMGKYYFEDGKLYKERDGLDLSAPTMLIELIAGNAEIVKLPWKPKMFETYRSFDIVYGKLVVCYIKWTGLPYQYALLDKGWVYRTKEEAQAALPAVAKEIGMKYEP